MPFVGLLVTRSYWSECPEIRSRLIGLADIGTEDQRALVGSERGQNSLYNRFNGS
jgi:hypothetical protein